MTVDEAISALRSAKTSRSQRIYATRILCEAFESLAEEAAFLRDEGQKWRAAFHAANATANERATALRQMAVELIAAANACDRAGRIEPVKPEES